MARIYVSQSRGCWVDLYERPQFKGRSLRLFGPCNFVNLYVAPEPWGHEARSLVAGPAAYVQCFEELNPDDNDSVAWFAPGQRVADVAQLPADSVYDSLRLFDRPPFAAEPGFLAYSRAHGLPPPLLKLTHRAARRR
jgi:hypothetical protein